jgi:hypothetical protein
MERKGCGLMDKLFGLTSIAIGIVILVPAVLLGAALNTGGTILVGILLVGGMLAIVRR